jgi:hypothetical protein
MDIQIRLCYRHGWYANTRTRLPKLLRDYYPARAQNNRLSGQIGK